jgi:putative endonuclease
MDNEFLRPRLRPTETDTRAGQQVAFRTGISAESRAAAFLIAKGFRILARRWKCPLGEIDIIARRRALLIFVEVLKSPQAACSFAKN